MSTVTALILYKNNIQLGEIAWGELTNDRGR